MIGVIFVEVCEQHADLVSTTTETQKDVALIRQDTDSMKTDVKEILICLRGNSKIGLTTQVELNRVGLKRSWVWLSGTGLLFVASFLTVLFKVFF